MIIWFLSSNKWISALIILTIKIESCILLWLYIEQNVIYLWVVFTLYQRIWLHIKLIYMCVYKYTLKIIIRFSPVKLITRTQHFLTNVFLNECYYEMKMIYIGYITLLWISQYHFIYFNTPKCANYRIIFYKNEEENEMIEDPTWITFPYWITEPINFEVSDSFCSRSTSAACWNKEFSN